MRFLLVDRVIACDPGNPVRGLKCVAMSEDVLEFHFPGNPIMPGALLLEALIQLAGWGEAASSDFQRWFLMDRVRRVAFYGFARPGDTVELEVEPLGPAAVGRRGYRASGSIAGTRKIAAEFEGLVVALAELEDPETVRQTFSRLTRARDW
jgi:3-hydroxyacyl-[acyl-carrier-protein] dehydratase